MFTSAPPEAPAPGSRVEFSYENEPVALGQKGVVLDHPESVANGHVLVEWDAGFTLPVHVLDVRVL